MTQLKAHVNRGSTELILDSVGPSTMRCDTRGVAKRGARDAKNELAAHTVYAMTEYAVSMRIAFKHVPDSLTRAATVLHIARVGAPTASDEQQSALYKLVGRTRMGAYLPHIDDALEMLTQSRIEEVILLV